MKNIALLYQCRYKWVVGWRWCYHNFMWAHYHDFTRSHDQAFIWSRFHVVFALHISPSRCSFCCLVCISTMLYRIISMNVGTGLCHSSNLKSKLTFKTLKGNLLFKFLSYCFDNTSPWLQPIALVTIRHHGYNTSPWLQPIAMVTAAGTPDAGLHEGGLAE